MSTELETNVNLPVNPVNDDNLHSCDRCGKTGSDVTYGPNPYMEDIYGDSTPEWLCASCRDMLCDEC
jgi:hypothetical protein